jgi:citrate lyase subunit beta/citryl-CoA lyase
MGVEARELPTWRSMLFVPANVEKFIDKAPAVGADAVQLDLEDAVAASEKDVARRALVSAARRVGREGADVTVRINRPWRLAVRDLEEAVVPEIDAIACPMVDSAEHIQALCDIVSELESERGLEIGRIKLTAAVETARAFFRLAEIAAANVRLVSISLGSEDFALSAGMMSTPETLLYPKQQVILAARAAGIVPMGFIGSIADFRDMDAFREIVRRSKRFGFRGATCIHPNQVKVCNEEFGSTPEEVALAEKIVTAYDAALAQGVGAINIEGVMVDVPVADAARELLALHRARNLST